MKKLKIPNLFVTDPAAPGGEPMVNPECKWVMDGEGIATRMYDGVCVLFDGRYWWARCTVPVAEKGPAGFLPIEHQEEPDQWIGWEPMSGSRHLAAHSEAVEPLLQFGGVIKQPVPTGTYELVGPTINGNPEHAQYHRLEKHANAEQFDLGAPPSYEVICEYALGLLEEGIEGIVWQHADGRMAKVRGKDFSA